MLIISRLVVDLKNREAGWGLRNLVRVANGVQQADHKRKHHDSIENIGNNNALRYSGLWVPGLIT